MTAEPPIPHHKWPNVPACYGWLTLDPRGEWRLGESGAEVVRHTGLKQFLNRNYGNTDQGEWFVQNGPQRVYVTLTRAPYVVRKVDADTWQTHTGRDVRDITELLTDPDGNIYMVCEHGLAGIDDRDLASLLCTQDANSDDMSTCIITLGDQLFPLKHVDADLLPERFGFVHQPSSKAL